MEEPSRQTSLTYSEVISGNRSGGRRPVDVPVGHAISLLLPTLRFGISAYAAFASPMVREPEQSVSQGPPDRWWLLDSRRGALALFALCSLYNFTDAKFGSVTIGKPVKTVTELRKALEEIRGQIDAMAPVFFRGEPGDADSRHRLYGALQERIPEVLWPQHLAIVPDFFEWLKH